MNRITHVLETALYASDLEAAESFYSKLFQRKPYHYEPGQHIFYKLEEAMFLVFNPETTADNSGGIPSHCSRGTGHACFRLEEAELEEWKNRLAELGIPLETEHIWPNGAASLYFRDPAGNSLELASWRIWSRYG